MLGYGFRSRWRQAGVLTKFLASAVVAVFAFDAGAQSKNLAPDFSTLPKGAKVVLMPADIELFSISAGGVPEPRADWTEIAQRNFNSAIAAKERGMGLATLELSSADADDLSEVNYLHAAVARAIALHHFGPSNLQLPTKNGKLDWSMGESVDPIRQRTRADYALFTWFRDSYASSERVATMVLLALVGVGLQGGSQTGYASLVDLRTGNVVWFNRLSRRSGSLREADKADETVEALLENFPLAK